MSASVTRRFPPGVWVVTLAFASGFPNAVIDDTVKFMLTDFHLTTIQLGLVTSFIYWAFVFKAFWSPLVDHFRTKRWWIFATECALGLCFLGLALAIQSPNWLFWTQVCLFLMAVASATQDIAVDGYYMLELTQQEQAGYSGFRSTSYRLALLGAKGALIYLAGWLTHRYGLHGGWSAAMCLPGLLFLGMALYHALILPRPERDVPKAGFDLGVYTQTFVTFFSKPRILPALAFMLLFRLGEAQALAMVAPFLKGSLAEGGLALSNEQVGLSYGTIGVVGLLLGGIVAGKLIAAQGLRRWYWVSLAVMHLPILAFLYLALSQTQSLGVISGCLFLEQFGYSFGFTLYILYLMYFARGQTATSHYAIATGFMALSSLLPRALSGFVQSALGYPLFFGYVALCTLPSFAVAWLAWSDKDFLDYYHPHKPVQCREEIGLTPEPPKS